MATPPSPLHEVAAVMRQRMRLKIDFLQELPPELGLQILNYLDAKDLENCSRVSSHWNHLSHDECLWKVLCERRWKNKLHKKFEPAKLDEPKHASAMDLKNQIEKLSRLCFSNWKWSYFLAERDAFRCNITIDELCDTKWKFSFRFFLPPGGTADQKPLFHKDGTFTSRLHNEPLPWVFEEDATKIRVANYPSLVAMRTASWGWVLCNDYVTFTSLDESKKISEESTPLLLL